LEEAEMRDATRKEKDHLRSLLTNVLLAQNFWIIIIRLLAQNTLRSTVVPNSRYLPIRGS
jgi:hypothetical protein